MRQRYWDKDSNREREADRQKERVCKIERERDKESNREGKKKKGEWPSKKPITHRKPFNHEWVQVSLHSPLTRPCALRVL